MPFIANFKLNVSLVRLWRLAAILITSVTLAVPPRAHSQTPQNLLDQKRQSATQPNYLLIQPQYPRPAMAPAVFYLLPLHPVDAPNPVLKSPYTHQLPYQFPNQVQSLPPQYFIPSPGIPGLNPIQPPTPRSNP